MPWPNPQWQQGLGLVLHLLHGSPGRGVWRLGSRVQVHGVTRCPHLFPAPWPACPLAPGLLASHPRSPLRPIPEPVILPGALLPTRPGSGPLPLYRVSRAGAGFRHCASQRGPGNRATGSQSRACQLPSSRDQGGKEGGTSPPANRGGFLGHRVRGQPGGPCRRCCRGSASTWKGGPEEHGDIRAQGRLWEGGGCNLLGTGSVRQLGNCSWAKACLAISDLGAGSSPQVPDQAGREEWPGTGGLESEVGIWGKQLDEGSGAQERQIWVREGCPGPQADQSQLSCGGGHQRSGGRRPGWPCSWGRGQ